MGEHAPEALLQAQSNVLRRSMLCEGVELLIDVATVKSTDPEPYNQDPFFFRNLALRALYSLCVLHPPYRVVVSSMGARQPLEALVRDDDQTNQEVSR